LSDSSKKLKLEIESLGIRNLDLTSHLHDLQKFLAATLENPNKQTPSSHSVDREKSVGVTGAQARNRGKFHLELNSQQNNMCWRPKTSRNPAGLSNCNLANNSVGNAFYIGRGTTSKEHQNSNSSKHNLGANPGTASLLIPSSAQAQNLQEIFFVPGTGRSKFNLKKSLHDVLQKRGSAKNMVGNHLLIPTTTANKGLAIPPRLGRVSRPTGEPASSLSARAKRTTGKHFGERETIIPIQSVENMPVYNAQPESDRKRKHLAKRSTVANIGTASGN
jgi:hypothetical protein